MMKITQDMDYEGANEPVRKLVNDLKDYYNESYFRTGIDWQWQTYWALMEDEQALVFILKHPEYEHRFRKTGD
jgi:hypothetical protein